MRKSLLVLGILCLLGACRKPETHLPPDRMIPILADLHLADAYSNMIRDSTHPNAEKNYDSLAVWTNQIFAKHKITAKEFTKSLDWYRNRPVELDSLFAAVLPVLEKAKTDKK
jgi:hypothetical protein